MLEIKILAPDEAPLFHELRIRALQDHPGSYDTALEDEKLMPIKKVAARLKDAAGEEPEEIHMGAFAHENLVGIICFSRDLRVKHNHKGVIWGAYLLPEWRGLGIGKEMMVELVNLVRKMPGLEQIHVRLDPKDKIARYLCESMNFKAYGHEEKALKIEDGRKTTYVDREEMALFL